MNAKKQWHVRQLVKGIVKSATMPTNQKVDALTQIILRTAQSEALLGYQQGYDEGWEAGENGDAQ